MYKIKDKECFTFLRFSPLKNMQWRKARGYKIRCGPRCRVRFWIWLASRFCLARNAVMTLCCRIGSFTVPQFAHDRKGAAHRRPKFGTRCVSKHKPPRGERNWLKCTCPRFKVSDYLFNPLKFNQKPILCYHVYFPFVFGSVSAQIVNEFGCHTVVAFVCLVCRNSVSHRNRVVAWQLELQYIKMAAASSYRELVM